MHCGHTVHSDEANIVIGRREEEEEWCEDCTNAFTHRCTHCDNITEETCCVADAAGAVLCNNCYSSYILCSDCGLWTDDWDEHEHCPACSTENEHIHQYHSDNHNLQFHPNSNESLYFGVELEVEGFPNMSTAATETYALSEEESLFHLEEDVSLHNGFEVITQPCSLQFHQTKFPWTKITRTIVQNKGKSESAPTAALHVHFSKSFFQGKHSELYQLRLIYIFERFWTQLVILGRTSEYLLNRSCCRYRDPNLFDCPARSKIREFRNYYGRYMAVNLASSQETIEIRIFRGTLTPRVIIASIELVDFLVRLAKNTSTPKLQQLTWASVLKKIHAKGYLYLPAYLEEKDAEHL